LASPKRTINPAKPTFTHHMITHQLRQVPLSSSTSRLAAAASAAERMMGLVATQTPTATPPRRTSKKAARAARATLRHNGDGGDGHPDRGGDR
jgi:hypothetical protein